MNKLNLATDFQELTCEQAAAIQGGAEIVVYTDANFGGSALSVTAGNAGEQFEFTGEFNNSISSIKVLSGTWEFVTGSDNTGLVQTLGLGEYSTVHPDMNDTISLAIATVA